MVAVGKAKVKTLNFAYSTALVLGLKIDFLALLGTTFFVGTLLVPDAGNYF